MIRLIYYQIWTSVFIVAFILSLYNLMSKFTAKEIIFSLILSILSFSGFLNYLIKTFQEIIKKDGGKW